MAFPPDLLPLRITQIAAGRLKSLRMMIFGNGLPQHLEMAP